MARPKMKATRDKRENEKKEKRKAPSDAGVSPPKKKTKPTEQRSLKDIDQMDVNVDEMLNKILAERAKFDKLTGELIFTAKELVAIGANSFEYLSYCYPLGLSMIVQAFMEIASLTLQRGSLREIKVLLAPEDVWQLFLQVADSWIKCKLTHPVGNIPALSIPNSGEKNYREVIQQVGKNRKKMRANWFKPFQGMEAKEVKRILEKLMEEKLLLRKSSKSDDARDDLQTFCTWMKIEDRLFEEIIRFFETKFSKGVTRKQLRREYPISRSFLKEIQSLLAEEDVAALKRNAKWEGVPAVLETKLIALHKAATSELISDRKDPFSIIETCGDLTSSKSL
ncbi:hypothetical protein R1sor_010686 [Riccia sorocarpa]|uniref:Uncharacterized protein n=1 Tax=Riccia sorocarpa TaxID=122646 RepID=A0ABD3I2C4_9MARC